MLDLGRRAGFTLVLPLLALPALSVASRGQCQPPFHQQLVPGDGGIGQAFGVSVSLDGERLLIGAQGDDEQATMAGAAYVFDYDGEQWHESAKLVAPDGDLFDHFGLTCALSGDWAVVGAPSKGPDVGAVYAFRHIGDAWLFQQQLPNPAGEPGSFFGNALALSGDQLIVGTPYSNLDGTDNGRAYAYRLAGHAWLLEQTLHPPSPQPGGQRDVFGWSVGLSGTTAVVTAPYANAPTTDSGSAYIYEWNGSWTQTAALTPVDSTPVAGFGRSVAIWQDKVLVGAPYANQFAAGAAFAFERSGSSWVQTAELQPPAVLSQDQFGETVALYGNHALVFGFGPGFPSSQAGEAWLFADDGVGWTRLAKIVGSDTTAGDSFGSKLALGPAHAVLGAFNHDALGLSSGVVYAYSVCPWEDLGGAHPGASGPPVLAGSGTLTAGSGNALSLTGAAASAPCVIFVAAGAAGAAPFKGGVLKAVPVLLSVGLATGAGGALTLHFDAPPLASGTAFVLQAAVADAGASAGVALSNALLANVP